MRACRHRFLQYWETLKKGDRAALKPIMKELEDASKAADNPEAGEAELIRAALRLLAPKD